MYLRYTFTDLESQKVIQRISNIVDITFDVDSECSVLTTTTGERLFLDTNCISRHEALVEAVSLAICTKNTFMSLQGVVLTIPDTKDYSTYNEYYEQALLAFEDCRGYVLFVGSHSYTF